MKELNEKSMGGTPTINCLEVLIPRMYLDNNVDNICWTLSVYSLENAPVESMNHSDAFHFMVYDWRRTIRKLLEQHQIPFSVVQYFTFDTIPSAAALEPYVYAGDGTVLIDTPNRPPGRDDNATLHKRATSSRSPEKTHDLMSL
jgi:hypothetical protein